MVHSHLTARQRQEWPTGSRHASGRVALRAQMVLLSDRDFRGAQISTIHDGGAEVVRTWLHR